MDTTLRKNWTFEGYVVSDCGAITDIWNRHHYAPTIEVAAVDAFLAGTDLDCGNAYDNLAQAIKDGYITEEQIDESITRLFTLRYMNRNVLNCRRMMVGEFDPPELNPYRSIPMSVVDSPEHRELATQVAREGVVLLKNDHRLLPLSIDV